MLSLFRNIQVSTAVLLAIYAFALHAPAILGYVPVLVDSGDASVLYNDCFSWLHQNPVWASVAATVIVFIQAFWLSSIVDRFRMLHDRSWLPAVSYVLVASLLPDFLFISPVLVGITFLLPVTSRLFDAYKQPALHALVFDVGLWLAVGALFFPPLIWLLPAVFIGFFMLRAFDLRYQAILLLGFFVPFFLCWTVYFWLDRSAALLDSIGAQVFDVYRFGFDIQLSDWYKLGLVVFLTLILILNSGEYYRKRLIQVQKYINVLFALAACTFLVFLTRPVFHPEFVLVFSVPASIYLSMTFESFRRNWMAELLHLLLLAGIFTLQFLPQTAH